MSTLKVNTIQDTSGSNSSTAAEISQGRAKVWINFQGSGTATILQSYNVSSLTDNGTGNYTINYSSALANANGASLLQFGRADSNSISHVPTEVTASASSLRFRNTYSWSGGGANTVDVTRGYVAVFNV